MRVLRVKNGPLNATPFDTEPLPSDVAAVLFAENMYVADFAAPADGSYDPDFTIIAQTGGFTVAPASVYPPEAGLYVWRQAFYWWNYASVTGGTDGMCYGGWYSEVTGTVPYTQNLSYVPFFKSGSSPSAFRYHFTSGIVGIADVGDRIEVYGGPQVQDPAVLSGDAAFDMYFTLAKVSSLTASATCD